jgi:hypothetical protein
MQAGDVDVTVAFDQRYKASASFAGSPQLIGRAFREMNDVHVNGPCYVLEVCLLSLFEVKAASRQFRRVVEIGRSNFMIGGQVVLYLWTMLRMREYMQILTHLDKLGARQYFDTPQ